MSKLDITLFRKDTGMFYINVIVLSIYLLFYGSPVLSITPIAPIYNIFSYVIVGVLVLFGLLYIFDKVLIKKRFSTIDMLVVMMSLFTFYLAITSNLVFDQPVLKGMVVAGKTYLPLISIFFLYYLLKNEKITMLQYNYATLIMCWFTLALNILLMYTINPALYKDTELVGYNPSKGGYVFNFPAGFIIYGLAYYFIDYTINKNRFSLLLSFILIAYILFIDKGRILFLTTVGTLALHMLWILPFKVTMLRTLTITLFTGLMVLIVWLIQPELLNIVYKMFAVFLEAIFGIETGESSADARWVEIASILSHFDKYPGHWFFGVGMLPRDELWLRFGYLYFTDVGIFGILFVFGIVGTILLYLFFLYPLMIIIKVKNFKYDLIYNTAIAGVITQLLNSFFNGGFAFAPIAIMNTFMFLEYYKDKDKKIEFLKRRQLEESRNQNPSSDTANDERNDH
jgi:hypothetical protein